MIPNGAQSLGGTARTPSPARDAVDAYERTWDLTALEQGIRFTRAALRQAVTVPAGDPLPAGEQVALRIDLAVLLSTYGNAVGDGNATGEGLRLFAQAAAAAHGAAGATAARQASRALASWASALVSEHDRTGAAGLLTEARGLAGQAIDAAVPGTTQRSDALSALAGVLVREYQDTGSLPAIDEAVMALRESVALAERGDDPDLESGRDPDLDAQIHKLAVALNLRASARISTDGQDSHHGQEGRDPARDHAEAVALLRAVLDRTPAGSPQRPDRLAALATVLHDGHEEFSTDTADEALALSAQAHATARGPKRALFAADLAAGLLSSFQRVGDKAILDRAVGLLADAARTPGLDDPALAEVDTRLGAVLTTRYVQFGDPADLDAALEALGRARTRDALRGHDRVQAVSDLGAALHELHVRSGQPAQLQEAIEVLEAGRREAGSSRARVFRGLLANLGTVYLGHHEVFGDRESLDSAIECRLDLYHAIRWTTHAADVINDLLTSFGVDRYAELVIDGQSPYLGAVNARVKRSVPARSQASAAAAVRDADVVLVDSSHDEDDCLQVLEACLAETRDSAAIVVHDSNPPTEWHQRPVSQYRPGEEWNGTVWKAVVRFRRAHPDVAVVTLDVDWGCTVIRRGPAPQPVPTLTPWLTWDVFDQHRDGLLNLRPATWAELRKLAEDSRAGR